VQTAAPAAASAPEERSEEYAGALRKFWYIQNYQI
jgi:hypothetical protein